MDINLKPNLEQVKYAERFIKLADSTKSFVPQSNSSTIVSRLAKNIKTINAPVPRFFESSGQVSDASKAEYDLVSVFKLLKYEPYFLKACQKKQGLLVKSGFKINSDKDEIRDYIDARFAYMFLQTGKSLREIIHSIAYYMIIASNAFVIKVRDKKFAHAQSYKKDGKEMHPIVGLFIAHPTSMKPRFKRTKMPGKYKYKLEIDKWVHFNARGETAEFNPDDVVHFTLFKEDGMVYGMPEVIPVIDDIRTLRKIEEDVQLLIYRDLFPIIHYSVEDPQVIDHQSGTTELDQAKNDMQNVIQDGGIATDGRHEIKFVGNEHKGIEAKQYLEYFQSRVFTGLGVSMADMGLGQDISGQTATSMSKQLTDAVRYIQQELAQQFNEEILTELALQSPFGIDAIRDGNLPVIKFNEIDIEWKIRQENHEADLFTKNVKTVDEVRSKISDCGELTKEDLSRTYQGLIGQLETDQQTESTEHITKVSAASAPKTVKTATGGTKTIGGAKDPGKWNNPTSTGINSKSSADKDYIKSSKSNSNIVKSTRDSIVDNISIQDAFRSSVERILESDDNGKRKLDLIFAGKVTYETIKGNMMESYYEGVKDALEDISIKMNDAKIDFDIMHNIFEKVDSLRDDVINKLSKNKDYINIAAARVGAANKTEQVRAYNYGYALTCVNNNRNEFIIYSEHNDIANDSAEFIGKEITIDKASAFSAIPPFRTNSRLKIKLKENEDGRRDKDNDS